MANDARHDDRGTTLIVGTYLVLAIVPFVLAATHSWFWHRQHYHAPVAVAVFAILLCALLLRQRWAWFVLVFFNGFVVLSYAWSWTGAPAFIIDGASLSLLLSPPMRCYVRKRESADVDHHLVGSRGS